MQKVQHNYTAATPQHIGQQAATRRPAEAV